MARIVGKKTLNGWALGVYFVNGVAETTNAFALAAFAKLPGYKVGKVSLAKPFKVDAPEKAGGDA